ncbi:hypothetical protein CBQ28_10415 [Pseudoalteromonas sp. GCY]|uniref:DUF3192 domain-containing protein n=2 Tax=Pseudoalteromonas TaxID=53246 RepID=A0A8I2KNM7_9GAMM|nr:MULTISPECIES: DUF3192 domain-containing protein [Pseudoalteromonas]ATD07505.1 hypothetical protein PPIS_a2561 [Pseudoalteromonas piscicida]MCF7512214.1 DUF3192 domain-containing protein [Pseudoalteromonas sp. L7]MCF7524572.1 DUF3192 domain-containing protein [Pseudoalteromonas sp. L23]MCG9767955.1 DUF3192 domain-containing protein [Pseudoalteromonas piscicida]MCX2766611.1 DUF3192 domain-containing protein [Pseudoalteromonas sp. B530]
MKKLMLVAALSSTLLSGCIVAVSDGEVEHGWASEYNSSNWEHKQRKNREKIANLEMGASYSSVKDMFTTPDFSELVSKDGDNYQVLYYATNSKHSDGKVTKDECTPLVFKNNQLVGFGDNALKQIQ